MIRKIIPFILLTGILAAAAPVQSNAQQSVQVSVTGIPPILSSPFVSELERNFRTGVYQVQLNYMGGTTPIDIYFTLRLTKDGQVVVDERSRTITYDPGFYVLSPFFDEVTFERSEEEIFGDIERTLRNQVLQSGALPEGNYTITIDVRAADPGVILSSMPGIATFMVRYPQPPILLTPPDLGEVSMQNTIFSWTPVLAPGGTTLDYDFLLVEVFPRQNPGDALLSNRAHHQETLTNLTTFPYRQDLLPFEYDKMYAWQVTARDANDVLPLKNDGKSEINTFTFRRGGLVFDPRTIRDIKEIVLVPGFAKIVDLENLEAEELADRYVLNGTATIVLDFTGLGTMVKSSASLNNLSVQKTGLSNPTITGGGVSFRATEVNEALIPPGSPVELTRLQYEFGTGITGTGRITTDDFGRLDASGRLTLTAFGLYGELVASGRDLIRYDGDIISIVVDEIVARFPEQSIFARASVEFFGEPSPCRIAAIDLNQENVSANFWCEQPQLFPLGPVADRLTLNLNRTTGYLLLNRDDRTVTYDLQSSGVVTFSPVNSDPCGIRAYSRLQSGSDPEFSLSGSTCTVPEPELNLGFAHLLLRNMQAERFVWNLSSREWDFAIRFDARLKVPAYDNWTYTPDDPFRITKDGIEIPRIDLTTADLPAYDHNGVRLRLNTLAMDAFTFPWFRWQGTDAGPWNLDFSATARFDDIQTLPVCLGNWEVGITDGRVRNGEISAVFDTQNLESCRLRFGSGHALSFTQISGSIRSSFNGQNVEPAADIDLRTRFEAGEPFTCNGTTGNTTDATLSIRNGLISGELTGVQPGCDLQVGPFTGSVSQASIVFSSASGVQGAAMQGSASLRLSAQDQVSGTFGIDLMTGRFTALDFRLERPFTWDLPSNQPVLSFVISSARLNLEGLYVDGRQQARIGGTTMNVTFDELLMDVNERRITSGRIIFDEAFALSLTLDGDSPTFRAVPANIANAPARGVYFELGGAVVVDSAGIKTSGSAAASLLFGDLKYSNAEVVFSDDFSLGLVPFEVSSGRADFYYDEVMVAWLDQSGLHPLISGLAQEFLPDRLPLPTLQIAWLTLRDQNGALLVDIQEPGDGTIRLQTRQGTPLELVIPLLDPSNPPVLGGVELNNFVISATPGNMSVKSGSINVLLPENGPLADLLYERGLPLKLRRIAYGVTQESPDQAALRLLGDLRLFDRIIEGATDLAFTVFDDGLLMADLDLQNLGISIPMLDFTDKFQLELDAINGYITLPALTGGSVNIDLEIDGNFRINAASPAAATSAITLQLRPGHTSLQRFDPIVLPEPYPIDLGGFSFILNEMRSLPVFEYDRINGWDITVDLDVDLRVNLADGEFFQLPMSGVLLGTDGFTIPAQNISSSSIPGLSLPTFDLAGFSFKPLALRTQAGVTFNWLTGELPAIDPRFDFEVQLPELPGINPPDGMSFLDVGFADGLLSGSMAPYNPLGGILIPLGPPQLDPPVIRIDELTGALETIDIDGIISQVVNLEVSGALHELPFFDKPETGCTVGGTYTLRIVEGRAFEGTVANVAPCGSKTYGPLTLSAGSSSLLLAFDGERQQASLQGSFTASVPSPVQNAPDIKADGTLTVDLIAATITDGQLAINEPFLLPIPASATDPMLLFTVNNALLNRDGFRINGAGSMKAGNASVNATFDNLLLGLPDFGIRDGRTVIAGGFGVDLTISPLKATLTAANAPFSANDMLRFSASADVVLDSLGLNYTGSGSAGLIFQGETFASLRAEFEDNFAFRTSMPRVRRGQALFFLDTAQPGEEPLAILDEFGIRIGGGLLAALPDTIGLPSKNIAYVVIKNARGDLLVNLESGPQGGYLLQTGATPLPVVFPSLAAPDGTIPQVAATFSLSTDDTYTPNGGTLSVQTALDLQPFTGLPLHLDSLGIDLGNTGQLAARLKLNLPEAFGDHTARGTVYLNSNGFVQGSLQIGNHSETYDHRINPIYERELISALSGSQQNESFTVSLFGARLDFGQSNSLRISGTMQSSLFTAQNTQPFPLFYKAGYNNGNWDFAIENSGFSPVIRLGQATVEFDEHNPFSVIMEQGRFGIGMNGLISFEEFLNEPVEFSFADLQVGIEQLPNNPRLYFSMGAASASLPEQTFSLFEDALVVSLINPSLAIQGRTITASVAQGDLKLLGKTINYSNLSVDTDGNFNIGAIETNEIQIIQNYLVLKQLGLSRTDDEGLKMSSTFGVFVPDPIDYSTDITILVGRDSQNKVKVTTENPLACPFDNTFTLGPSVAFKLDCVDVDINPRAISETGIYVAGRVMINDESRISLGVAGDIRNKPGIAIKGGSATPVRYNVTGNGAFDFSYSFFRLTMDVNSTASSNDRFRLVLNGQAGLNIDGVSLTAPFKDMIITRNGIEDIGKFDGTASFILMGIATLELGSFVHEKNDNGFNISITEATNEKPGELQQRAGQQAPTKQLAVTELLCFGPCSDFGGSGSTALSLSLGGSNTGGGGGFSGSLGQVLFYRTTQGHVTLYIDGFRASLGDQFDLFAALHYEGQGDNGMKLRVAGGGNFKAGGMEVGAVVAGVFSNVGDELSFGIFAAVRSDVGIPIVPGIVDLTGAGGGFFVKASRDDIKFATDAINAFRGTTFGGRQITPIDPGKYANKPFTVMLYAEVGIAGAGGMNVLKGQTFFAISGSSFFMDVTGSMLGLDGSKLAGLKMLAGMTLDITTSPDFFLIGNIWADIEIPLILKGGTTGQGIQYFAGKQNGQTLWGVMGGVQVSVYSGLISGSASILAGNRGFMLDATLGLDFLNRIPIISASGSLSGGIWFISGSNFPFGAYVTAEINISFGISVTAELRAAFVTTKSGGFEFFGSGRGCINLLFGDSCLSGWILIGTNVFDYGTGSGKHADLVNKAEYLRDQFAAELEETRRRLEGLKNAMEEIPPFEGGLITAEDASKAGHHLYQSAYNLRLQWASKIRGNERLGSYTIPSVLDQILTEVVEAARTYQQTLEQQEATSTQAALDDVAYWVNQVQYYAEETLQRIGTGNDLAQIYASESFQALDNMYDIMAESPIRRFNTPPPPSNGNITEPDFDVDTNTAASHHTAGAQTLEAIEALDAQIRAAIEAIEENLTTMNRILELQITSVPQVTYNPLTGSYTMSGQFSIAPSVNAVSLLYANAISGIRNYYARQANKQWAEVVWAEGRRSWINNRSGQISSAMNTLLSNLQNAHVNRTSNTINFTHQRNMMTERVNLIESLRNKRSPGQHNSYSIPGGKVRQMYDGLGTSNPSWSTIRNEDIQHYWFTMHEAGLYNYALASARSVNNELVNQQSSLLSNVVGPLRTQTRGIETFYALKSNILANLYSIIDSYVEVRSLAAEPDEVTLAYQQRLSEISDMLQPPVLSQITVDPRRTSGTFFNTTSVQWSASHPVNIQEVSVDLQEYEQGTSVLTGVTGYMTIGNPERFTYSAYKSNFDRQNLLNPLAQYNTKQLNIGLRVRGPGGNVAYRRAVFNVDVGNGGTSTQAGQNILAPDITPPENIMLNLDAFYNKHQNVYHIPGGPTIYADRYVTNDPNSIQLHILSWDPESGISRFEYAVGTNVGGTDVVEWTELPGAIEFWTAQNAPAFMIKGRTRILNMQPGQNYYVSVRSYNGAGLMSPINRHSVPVVYDDTPPSIPGVAYMAVTMPFLMYMGPPPVNPVVQTVPKVVYPSESLLIEWANPTTVPQIQGIWAASTDEQSGILHYEYNISRYANVRQGDFDDPYTTTNLAATVKSGHSPHNNITFGFSDERYIHVRAVNKAGTPGEVRTIGPMLAPDPTSPTKPDVNAYLTLNDIRIYLPMGSWDAETRLKGYQYAVGTTPGGTDIRNWPSTGTIDHAFTDDDYIAYLLGCFLCGTPNAPYFSIPKSTLPVGPTLYVTVRGVNNRNMTSAVSVTGPINLDTTPPLTPTITMTRPSGNWLYAKVENIHDPESGFRRVEYKLERKLVSATGFVSWQTITGFDWRNQINYSTPRMIASTSHIYADIPNGISFDDIRIIVRITNGAGLQGVTTKNYYTVSSVIVNSGSDYHAPANIYYFNF
ncbi:MAG: hypothetical protein EA364_02240 [Balneolaceae bacterium]|nr:MAG: hypothetical protein EA364_02240 [Balneolaceae bacterium]